MEYNGAHVDMKVIKRLELEYTHRKIKAVKALNRLPRVRQFVADQIAKGKHGKRKSDPFEFNPGSDQQVAKILFEYYDCHPGELTDNGFKILAARLAHTNKKHPEIKFGQIVERAIRDKEWEFFTTSADVLNGFVNEGNDFAPLVLEYREVDKMLGTYILPVADRLDENGLVHGSFGAASTATGRLNSSSPNLQNQPPKARPAYTSRFKNGYILSIDQSQVELRVAACRFNDPGMIQAYIDGQDVHRLVAMDIAKMNEKQFSRLSEEDQKEWRTKAKRTDFGIIYQTSAIGMQVQLRKDKVYATLDECQALIDTFMAKRPGLAKGIEREKRGLEKRGYVENFAGRRRRIPEVFSRDASVVNRVLRQGVNAPIQSGASELTLMAMILAWRIMKAEGFKSLLSLQVHDSLVFDCPTLEEALAVAKLVKDIMENIHELSEEVWPGLDWSWLKVPLVADCDLGRNWDSAVKFNPNTVLANGKSEEKLHWKNEKGELMMRKPVNPKELRILADLKAAA